MKMSNARQSKDEMRTAGSEAEDTGHSGAQQQKVESAGVLQTKLTTRSVTSRPANAEF